MFLVLLLFDMINNIWSYKTGKPEEKQEAEAPPGYLPIKEDEQKERASGKGKKASPIAQLVRALHW